MTLHILSAIIFLMNILKNKYILGTIALILISSIIYIHTNNISLTNILNERPEDVVVANISTQNAQIYFKTKDIDKVEKIEFKDSKDTGLYKQTNKYNIYQDSISNSYIYVVNLEELTPNTEYVFRIQTESKTWEEGYTFKTKDISEEVHLPTITTGKSSDRTYVLIQVEDDKYMLDTQYHGTWALDTQGKEYTSREYGSYVSRNELQTKLLDLIQSPVYAQIGRAHV